MRSRQQGGRTSGTHCLRCVFRFSVALLFFRVFAQAEAMQLSEMCTLDRDVLCGQRDLQAVLVGERFFYRPKKRKGATPRTGPWPSFVALFPLRGVPLGSTRVSSRSSVAS